MIARKRPIPISIFEGRESAAGSCILKEVTYLLSFLSIHLESCEETLTLNAKAAIVVAQKLIDQLAHDWIHFG